VTLGITQSGDLHLRYVDVGTGEPPLLFIHGGSCDYAHFAPQVEYFRKTHRVVAYDQRGHGESAKCGTYTVGALAEDARWLCDELSLVSPVIIGHSLGGSVAIAVGAAYPELAAGLVLLDSAGFGRNPEQAAAVRTRIASAATDASRQEVRSWVGEGLFEPFDDPATVREIMDTMARQPWEVWRELAESWVSFDLGAVAARVRVPVMYVGTSRPKINLAAIAESYPEWYIGRTVGAGHFHQLFVPAQVNAMIDTFISQIERTNGAMGS
jgi:pimeloyl-ACP methyl ester carboxylesterase